MFVQKGTSEFVSFVPVATTDDGDADESSQQAGDASNSATRSAAQLFLSLWLALKEGGLLAVATYKGQAAWAPHPVALVVQEEQFGAADEQVRAHGVHRGTHTLDSFRIVACRAFVPVIRLWWSVICWDSWNCELQVVDPGASPQPC